MCFDCFKSMRDEFGAVEITPAIVEAARLSQEANHYGPLHVTIEDYNCGDDSVAFCAVQKRDKWTDADRACLAAFQPLTENERTHALALADGYIDATSEISPAWRTRRPDMPRWNRREKPDYRHLRDVTDEAALVNAIRSPTYGED